MAETAGGRRRAAQTVTVQPTAEQAAWFLAKAGGPPTDQADETRAALDMRLAGGLMTGPGKIAAAATRIHATWLRNPDAVQVVFCDSVPPGGLLDRISEAIMKPGRWEPHEALRRELTTLGVPRAAVRVAQGPWARAARGLPHDWPRNDALSAVVRDGPVRVLVTDTWNAIPGPMPRLAAVHHLDPAATPQGLERRERVIQTAGVQIIRYITAGTTDQGEWQGLDQKRSFPAPRTLAEARSLERAGRQAAARRHAAGDGEAAAIDAQLAACAEPRETVRLSVRAIAGCTRALLPEASNVVLGWNGLGQLAPAGFLDRTGMFIGFGADGWNFDGNWEADGYRAEVRDAIRGYCANLGLASQDEWARYVTPTPMVSAGLSQIDEYCIPVTRALAETAAPAPDRQRVSDMGFPLRTARRFPAAFPPRNQRGQPGTPGPGTGPSPGQQ